MPWTDDMPALSTWQAARATAGIIGVGLLVAVGLLGIADLDEQAALDAGLPPAHYQVVDPVPARGGAGTVVGPSTVPAPIPTVPSGRRVTPASPTPDRVGTVETPATRGTAAAATDTLPAPSTLPPWTDNVPKVPGGVACSREQATVIAAAFAARGASLDTQRWALLIVSRESGCRVDAHNNNVRTGDDSFGICQLNARSGHFGPSGVLAGWDRWRILTDLGYAAAACAQMWAECGRGPWTPPYSCRRPAEAVS